MTATPTYGNSCFPFAVNCRFSKAFIGVPKRCGYCQKMIVGTGFTCQHCSFKCHRRCIMIGQGDQVCLRPKPCSLSRLPPGDDCLISRLLKENEINSNDLDSGSPRNDDRQRGSNGNLSRKSEAPSAKIRRLSRPLINQASFSVPGSSLTSDDPCCSSSLQSVSTATSPSLMSQPSSPGIFGRKVRRSRRSTALSNTGTTGSRRTSAVLVNSIQLNGHASDERRNSSTSGFMDRLFRLFPSWSPQKDDSKTSSRNGLNGYGNGNGSIASLHSSDSRRVSLAKSKPLLHTKSNPASHHVVTRCITTRSHHGSPIAAKSAREFNAATLEKLYAASEERRKSAHEIILSSAQSQMRQQPPQTSVPKQQNGICITEIRSLTVTETKQASISPLLHKFRLRTGIQAAPTTQPGGSGHKFLRNHESDPIKIVDRKAVAFRDGHAIGRSKLRVSHTVQDAEDERDSQERLASTWPLCGVHLEYDEFDRLQTDEGVGFGADGCGDAEDGDDGGTREDTRNRQVRLSDLGEWTIPYTDLVLSECVHECRSMSTYRGRWHGDVMIHTYDICGSGDDSVIRGFLEEVRTLTKIRHENVALFMGASVEAPLLAVVTSIRKGCNLYETIHLENRRLAQTAKVNVARQVAQGMGYLHAKGIILRTLTSKSIYLECKVKISMVDDGAPLKRHDRPNMGCIRRGHLTYVSPELMQKARVVPPALSIENGFTKESDVFAFGTILFEMFANDFPFSHLPPFAVVWCIGTGRRQNLDNVHCSTAMKGLIEECWSADPAYRPSFTEILKELQHTSASHRKHSTSVPEKLNKAGMHRSPYNY